MLGAIFLGVHFEGLGIGFAGGLDYLVQVAEKLRSNPKYINYFTPTVTYILTLLASQDTQLFL
ncbi:hypothetical protein LR59_10315 [Campylobacter sp. MIT 97-5078]|nr:hypothetical protein LR59_10315 [Campylobacter sp. MIT 97-5078]